MSKIKLNQFDALFNASPKEARANDAERVKKRNIRAAESAIDSAEDQIDTLEEEINTSTNVVIKGGIVDFNVVAAKYRKIKDLRAVIEDIKDFKEDFFAKVKIEGKGRARRVSAVTDAEEDPA